MGRSRFVDHLPDTGLGARLTASPTDGAWTLTGDKPWCSLAGRLDHALVTAHVAEGRRLFAVDLHDPGVAVADVRWVARGLSEVASPPARFDRVPAVPVGETGWYLQRPGFAWGAIRVAACWLGGTRALLDSLRADLAARRDPGEIRLYNLGSADAAVWAATSRSATPPERSTTAPRTAPPATSSPAASGRWSRPQPKPCSCTAATHADRRRWPSTTSTPAGWLISSSTCVSTRPSATSPRWAG